MTTFCGLHPRETLVGPVVELLLTTLSGVGLYAGFIGIQQRVKAVTSAICALWAGHLWALATEFI